MGSDVKLAQHILAEAVAKPVIVDRDQADGLFGLRMPDALRDPRGGPAELRVALSLEAHQLALDGAVQVAIQYRPLLQILLVDGFDHEAAPRLAQNAELADLLLREPLDGRCGEAEFLLAVRLVDGLAQAGQNVIANADGRTLICPRDVQEDAGRRAILLVPVQRRGDQIAVPVLAADDDHANLRQRLLAHAPPRVRDQAVGGKLLQDALEVYSIGALDAKGAGDLAAADIAGSWSE